MTLDTVWFAKLPADKGPGVIYARPASNARAAWNLACIRYYGARNIMRVEPEEREALLARWKRSLHKAGYRAVRCRIEVAK
jgi:hypothetical protein